MLWDLGRLWVGVWWTGLLPDTRRWASIGFLHGVLIAYGFALVTAALASVVSARRLIRARRRRERRPISARVLALSVATLLGLAMLELGAWGFAVWNRLPPPPPRVPPKVPEARASGELVLLVLGESSAEGQPFQPWFSIGHVVARQIEQSNPGKKVRIIMAASGGIPLASAVAELEYQKQRPDLVLLYAGHNEFQARWGWTRVVNYYADDAFQRPRNGLSDRVGDWTAFTRMIRDAVDIQRIDQPPSPKEIRALVERPVCEPSTRAALCRLFARELESIADWCDRAGAVPIFVIPAGNDVGFDPDRSILSPSALAADRAAFSRDFLDALSLERKDPKQGMAAYRQLIDRQPGFAESHYRLAVLLQADGKFDEASKHYTLARDLDGLPMRCPSEFQDEYRKVAARHPGLVLVDAPARLSAISPTGLLDDYVFHDGQHPTFRAYLALAEDALSQLRSRGVFGLDRSPSRPIDPSETASHFQLDAAKWAEVSRRSASFWGRLGVPRYDGSARFARGARWLRAADAIEKRTAPEEAGIPGLGVNPPKLR
ncbi:MAG: hypothetical protein JWN86_2922 [Planctomycetota bacterium]|nr:hypothetical protein [Planctomycetota bacterium]